MAAQHCAQGGKILGGLKSVKIVRPFAQNQPRCGKQFEPFAVAQSGATPIVALKNNDGAVEMKSFHGEQVPATLPKLLKDIHFCAQTL
jgi:hypothetical protein